jgi:uncharacterized repeat protein (TIGR04076 family)
VRVICTVVSLNYSACGLQVDDYFELSPNEIVVPAGKAFCCNAIQQVISLVYGRLNAPEPDKFLSGQPIIICPDPPESVRMRIEVVPNSW